MTSNNSRLNHNPSRIILRGDELPSLLLGSTFIDLRRVSELCRENSFDIEFYQQRMGDEDIPYTPSRFFVGRDSTQTDQDILDDGFDYRVELCECMPELSDLDSRQLETFVETLARNESNHYGGHGGNFPGEVVRTTPSFRIYRFETRPPFSETFIRETHRGDVSNPHRLSNLLYRYIGLHDSNLSERLRATTDDLFDRYND
tara:strand:- start:604 stop:1209 length:606 start_codon:yes stop_codon:yes gene_type:complete